MLNLKEGHYSPLLPCMGQVGLSRDRSDCSEVGQSVSENFCHRSTLNVSNVGRVEADPWYLKSQVDPIGREIRDGMSLVGGVRSFSLFAAASLGSNFCSTHSGAHLLNGLSCVVGGGREKNDKRSKDESHDLMHHDKGKASDEQKIQKTPGQQREKSLEATKDPMGTLPQWHAGPIGCHSDSGSTNSPISPATLRALRRLEQETSPTQKRRKLAAGEQRSVMGDDWCDGKTAFPHAQQCPTSPMLPLSHDEGGGYMLSQSYRARYVLSCLDPACTRETDQQSDQQEVASTAPFSSLDHSKVLKGGAKRKRGESSQGQTVVSKTPELTPYDETLEMKKLDTDIVMLSKGRHSVQSSSVIHEACVRKWIAKVMHHSASRITCIADNTMEYDESKSEDILFFASDAELSFTLLPPLPTRKRRVRSERAG